MKKAYKIIWVSLASILGVLIIVLSIAMYLLLSPNRLTSLVNSYASDFITCDYSIGKVDLTFFDSFPDVGVEINDMVLVNPTEGCSSDTIAAVEKCVVSLNIKKLLFEDEIIINTCQLDGGYINVFYDKESNSNIDIFPPSEPEPETEETAYSIDLDQIQLNDVKLIYTDLAESTTATIDGLCMEMKGNIKDDIICNLSLTTDMILAEINDSSLMKVAAKQFAFNGDLEIKGDNISTNATINAGKLAFLMEDPEESISGDFHDMALVYNGVISDYDFMKGCAEFSSNNTNIVMDGDRYIADAYLSLHSPIECDINKYAIAFGMMKSSFNIPVNYDPDKYQARFEGSKMRYNNVEIDLVGELSMADDIKMNLDITTNAVTIPEMLAIVPESMRQEMLEGVTTDGIIQLKSHIEGIYNDEYMPVIVADVMVKDGFVEMKDELAYPISNINTTFHTNLDMNEGQKSDIQFASFKAKMHNSNLELSGNINDLLDKMLCDLIIKTNLNFNDVKAFMPDEMAAKGNVKANINFKGSVEQLENLDLMNTNISGFMYCQNLDFAYYDTINIASSDMKMDFVIPNPSRNTLKGGLAQVKIAGADLRADITNMMTAALDGFNIDAQVSNVLDDNDITAVMADFGANTIDFDMDDIVFHSDNASGSAFILPAADGTNTSYAAVYSSDSLVFAMGDELSFATETVAMSVNTETTDSEDLLLHYNPQLDIDLSNAVIKTSEVPEDIIVPNISMTFNEEGLNIENSQITLGNSDFRLTGSLDNVYEYLKDDELLKGEFTFTSEYADVNQLMDIFNGMGLEEEVTDQDTIVKEDNPFMVPYGMEITLHTIVNNATAGKMDIRNVGGDLTVKNGVLVLQEMGFTSDAAKMQLTAIYKSKRTNHLYVGFDFHLLDIDIAEMINIIPDLDTIVPMLKSFAGNAEFHFAAETNLKSDYSLKYSTLKAACSIEGKDLVILDSETFDMIKKKLFFNKKTKNVIDSLDVQFTVFKNEIDVYPFAVSMDKYSAMLYGRHNLDMSYDYNIAVLSPPILSRLGVEIKGPDFDNMKFKVRRSRHRNMFNPEKRDYKEEKIAELKKIISSSLKDNVKPQ